MLTAGRPRGRRPGNRDTRGDILAAARELFAGEGFDPVSLRGIARRAEVDPALVHHYFHSKAALFVEAMGPLADVEATRTEALACPPAALGDLLARRLIRACDDTAASAPLAELLVAGQPALGTLKGVQEYTAAELYAPLAAHLGHADAALRGQLAAGVALGVWVQRAVLDLRPLSATPVRSLVEATAPIFQHLVVEPW